MNLSQTDIIDKVWQRQKHEILHTINPGSTHCTKLALNNTWDRSESKDIKTVFWFSHPLTDLTDWLDWPCPCYITSPGSLCSSDAPELVAAGQWVWRIPNPPTLPTGACPKLAIAMANSVRSNHWKRSDQFSIYLCRVISSGGWLKFPMVWSQREASVVPLSVPGRSDVSQDWTITNNTGVDAPFKIANTD